VAALGDVAGWAAEPADQEVPEAELSAGPVVRRVHGPKDDVGRHQRVEGADEALDSVLSTAFVDLAFFERWNRHALIIE
jgi:hypothetical protein